MLQAFVDAPESPLSRLISSSAVRPREGILSAPEPRAAATSATTVAATTDEYVVIAIRQEILAAAHVGVHDNFFALGGHSLLARQLVSRVRDVLGIDVPVRTVLDAPTPRQFAAAVTILRDQPAPRSASVPGAAIPRLRRSPSGVEL